MQGVPHARVCACAHMYMAARQDGGEQLPQLRSGKFIEGGGTGDAVGVRGHMSPQISALTVGCKAATGPDLLQAGATSTAQCGGLGAGGSTTLAWLPR